MNYRQPRGKRKSTYRHRSYPQEIQVTSEESDYDQTVQESDDLLIVVDDCEDSPRGSRPIQLTCDSASPNRNRSVPRKQRLRNRKKRE